MKSIIAAVITCMILFGVSFAASRYFTEAAKKDSETPVENVEPTVDQSSTLPPDPKAVDQIAPMQVAFSPEKSVSLEAVLQMSDSIRKMEEKLILRETTVAKEEQRVQLLFSDLETEQDQLQAFSESIDAKIAALDRMTENLDSKLTTLETRKTEIASMEKDKGVDEGSQREAIDTKVNDVKGWFANLDPEQSSTYLKEFANNGKLEFAASLLQKLPDRQKSKILGAMSDPTLVNQLIDALQVRPKTE